MSKNHMINNIRFLFYRYRFLSLYVVFGFSSLLVEILLIRSLFSLGIIPWVAKFMGFIAGLALAFLLNVRFNFHIAPAKRKRALIYFGLISSLSFLVQLALRNELMRLGLSSEDLSRLIVAGTFFFISYLLHRKFSFSEYKKVGIAIYADGVEDIREIYNKIGSLADFIHLDIVDETFKSNCSTVKAYRSEVVRAYWPNLPVEVHIMSKKPSIWLSELTGHVDVIYVQLNLEEELAHVIRKIRETGARPGLVVGVNDSVEDVLPFIGEIKDILVLAIAQPGYSGQKFEMSALTLIEQFNSLEKRKHLTICVDGGVNANTIKYLNVEAVVSGSFVLNAPSPKKNIMILQTSGEYEKF